MLTIGDFNSFGVFFGTPIEIVTIGHFHKFDFFGIA